MGVAVDVSKVYPMKTKSRIFSVHVSNVWQSFVILG